MTELSHADKIMLVSHDAQLTGAPIVAFNVFNALAGIYPVVFVTKRGGPLLERIRDAGRARSIYNTGDHHELRQNGIREKIATAIGIIEKERPRVVLVNSLAAAEWLHACRQQGVPVVLYTHEEEGECRSLMSCGVIPEGTDKTVDVVIGASRGTLRAFSDVVGGKPLYEQVVGPVIDFSAIEERSIGEIEQQPVNVKGEPISWSRPVFCMCGTACERKGADVAVRLAEMVPDADFLWVGDWGHPVNRVADAILKDKQPSNFFMSGQVNNPLPYMRRANAFLLLSREDPNPLVVYEAMSIGKPVISFSSAGESHKLSAGWSLCIWGEPDHERLGGLLKTLLNVQDFDRVLTGGERPREIDGLLFPDTAAQIRDIERALNIAVTGV